MFNDASVKLTNTEKWAFQFFKLLTKMVNEQYRLVYKMYKQVNQIPPLLVMMLEHSDPDFVCDKYALELLDRLFQFKDYREESQEIMVSK